MSSRKSFLYRHFTPTYSSWLNQVGLWFAKIERDVIARGGFTSITDLKRKLIRYIRRFNEAPKTVNPMRTCLFLLVSTAFVACATTSTSDLERFVYVGPTGNTSVTLSIDKNGNIESNRGHVSLRTDRCSDRDMVVCTNSSFLPFALPSNFEVEREWDYGHYRYRASSTTTYVSIWGAKQCVYEIRAEPRDNGGIDTSRLDSWTFLFSKQYGLSMALRSRDDDALVELLYSKRAEGWGAGVLAGEDAECEIQSDTGTGGQ